MGNKWEMQEKMASASSCVSLGMILHKDIRAQIKHV